MPEAELGNGGGDSAGFGDIVFGGRPWATAQYAQFRVQTSPRIMNVAVPCSQHSPTLGQWASSQTEWSPCSRNSDFSRRKFGPPGARTLSHEGFRSGNSATRCRPII